MFASDSEDEYISNVITYIDECFNSNYVVGESGVKYNVRYDGDRCFRLVALEGRMVPENEKVNEQEIKDMYNDAVSDVIRDFYHIDGYHEIEDNCFESEENHYMLHNDEFEVVDESGDIVDVTDEFRQNVADSAKELCFEIINGRCLVDSDSCIRFYNSDNSESYVTQEFTTMNDFKTCQ